jgi:hypothetical protein
MNCLDCQEYLQRLLDGESIADAAFEQHLAECPPCRERHVAVRRLLDGLKAMPHAAPPPDLAARVVARVLHLRERRRVKLRRSLYVTAALAASILIMLVFAYFRQPAGSDGKPDLGPLVKDSPRKDIVPPPIPPVAEKKEKDQQPRSFAALTGRLADKTLDQAKVFWTVANPVEGMPIGDLPNVKELDPAAQPLRQAGQEVGESFEAVSHSARRAFDYFARELPMLDMPPGGEPK